MSSCRSYSVRVLLVRVFLRTEPSRDGDVRSGPEVIGPWPVSTPGKRRRMMIRLFAFLMLIAAAAMPVGAQAAEPSSAPAAAPTPAKKQTTTPPKPAPDVWSANEIAAAHKACKQILKKVSAVVEPVPPIKKGECGTPAPVRVIQIGKIPVTFKPAPILNCAMVGALAKWLKEGIQPLARKHLGDRVQEITVMSSYSCRRAYGRARTNLSEHALANALDIGSFVTAKGLETTLLANWGPHQARPSCPGESGGLCCSQESTGGGGSRIRFQAVGIAAKRRRCRPAISARCSRHHSHGCAKLNDAIFGRVRSRCFCSAPSRAPPDAEGALAHSPQQACCRAKAASPGTAQTRAVSPRGAEVPLSLKPARGA